MHEKETLEARLSRLERTNKRYARALAVFVCAAVALSCIGANPRKRDCEAERFILRDASGTVRAELSSAATGPTLSFFDPAGTERLRLHADDDGQTVVSLKAGVREEGSRRAIDIQAGNNGWSSLSFSDGGSQERLSLGLAYDGEPRLRMTNRQGRPRIGLGSDMCGRADLVIHDSQGEERAALRSAPSGTPTLTLYDSDGHKCFVAPSPDKQKRP